MGADLRSCLRALASTLSVSVMWSLDLLVPLVGAGQLPGAEAIAISADLHRISPRHLTHDTLAVLERQIEAL